MLECDLFLVLMHLLPVQLRLVLTLECELFLMLADTLALSAAAVGF